MSELRFIPKGDYQECLRLRGRANQIMLILEKIMMARGAKQLSTTVDLPLGGTIKCTNIFGQRTIEISVPGKAPEEVKSKRMCLCNCNFTTGWVIAVEENQLDDTVPLYTVMVCQGGDRYVMVEHVLASDWTVYEELQSIILIPYYGMQFLCCTGPVAPLGCKKMDYIDSGIDSIDWRSSLRIVPWCGISTPKWINIPV